MKKLCLAILFLTFSLYSQNNNVLIIRPDVSDFKKIELGIKSALRKQLRIQSISITTQTDINTNIAAGLPNAVVVMGKKNIRLWQRIRQRNREIATIPAFLVDNDFYVDGFTNGCIVNYETELKQYLNSVRELTGHKSQNIGIIYTSKSKNRIASYLREASHLNVKVHAKEVVNSDLEKSVSTIIQNIKSQYQIDFLVIVDDHTIINNMNIASMWLPVLSPLKIPVAIPADYFYELEPRIGSFAIKPHYKEIGGVIASVISSAKMNNWIIRQKRIITDKSIMYFRNADGSISKRNKTQNDFIAVLHQEINKPATDVLLAKAEETDQRNMAEPVKDHIVKHENVAATTPAPDPSPKITLEVAENTKNISNERNAVSRKNSVEKRNGRKIEKRREMVNKANVAINKKRKQENEPVSLAKADSPVKNKVSTDTKEPDEIIIADNQKAVKTQKTYVRNSGEDYQLLILFLILLVAIIILICFLLAIKIVKNNKKNIYNCLLITKKYKKLKYSRFYDKDISLVKYLKSHGFHVVKINNIDRKGVSSLFTLPDLICVDWQFNSNIQNEIYELLNEGMCTSNFILVFYNIPNVIEINKNSYFDHRTFFLDTDFMVSDINKILSGFLTDSHALQLTGPAKSCLEGKITEETLTEIFQMMDTGKKTGCLLVENKQDPVGMLFFEEGKITYAITNTQVTQQAVFEILATRHGRFKFIPDKKPVKKQMYLDTVGVLMEQAQIVDESIPIEVNEEDDIGNASIFEEQEVSIFESELESEFDPESKIN